MPPPPQVLPLRHQPLCSCCPSPRSIFSLDEGLSNLSRLPAPFVDLISINSGRLAVALPGGNKVLWPVYPRTFHKFVGHQDPNPIKWVCLSGKDDLGKRRCRGICRWNLPLGCTFSALRPVVQPASGIPIPALVGSVDVGLLLRRALYFEYFIRSSSFACPGVCRARACPRPEVYNGVEKVADFAHMLRPSR